MYAGSSAFDHAPRGDDHRETVRGQDWYGDDISDQSHERTVFQSADLSESTGSGARFVDCVFRSCDFSMTALTGAAFENCRFQRCEFVAARFTDCKFLGSRFLESTFDRMTVRGGDWSFVDLSRAALPLVTFADVRMREVDLSGVDARGATITGCDLDRGTWSRADLRKADLRGTDLTSLDPGEVQLAGAVVTWEQAVVVAARLGLDVRGD